ncbi:hypothetical protein UPM260_1157 [Salmonella enterica subsp. enterica serovar Typhimurium]|nr:hypothetical protein UPM260_1157 [Salmonella enterica subsp. enterica serovar Typhimurium]
MIGETISNIKNGIAYTVVSHRQMMFMMVDKTGDIRDGNSKANPCQGYERRASTT